MEILSKIKKYFGFTETEENIRTPLMPENQIVYIYDTLDIAKTIKFAYELPQGVNLREIQIADTKQDA